MKTKFSNPLFHFFVCVLLFVPFYIQATIDQTPRTKEYVKTFQVGPDDRVYADNKYGNITVTHWDKQEVSVKVVVTAKARTEERIKALLEHPQIRIEKQNGRIEAVTSFRSGNFSTKSGESFSIDYQIQMPAKQTCELNQKYGDIKMPAQNPGKCHLNVQYGNVQGGDFTGNCLLDIKYGNANIKNCSNLEVDGKYSNFTLGAIARLDLRLDYGNLQMEELENGSVELAYSKCTIEKVNQSLSIPKLGYTTMNIRELKSDFKKVDADARYSNLNIKIDKAASFSVDASNLRYGNCSIKGFDTVRRQSDTESGDFDSRSEKINDYRLKVNQGKHGQILFDGNSYSNIKVTTF